MYIFTSLIRIMHFLIWVFLILQLNKWRINCKTLDLGWRITIVESLHCLSIGNKMTPPNSHGIVPKPHNSLRFELEAWSLTIIKTFWFKQVVPTPN